MQRVEKNSLKATGAPICAWEAKAFEHRVELEGQVHHERLTPVHLFAPCSLRNFQVFFAGWRVTVSAVACCSSKRELGVFVAETLPSEYCHFILIFYLPAIPLHCKDILKKSSAWRFASVSRGVFLGPCFLGLWNPHTGFREGRNKPAFPGEGSLLPLVVWREGVAFVQFSKQKRRQGEKCPGHGYAALTEIFLLFINPQAQCWACCQGKCTNNNF